MKKIVERRHIGKKQGIQHKGTHRHQDKRLGGKRQVMPAKNMELSTDVCELLKRRWSFHVVAWHTQSHGDAGKKKSRFNVL